MKESNFLNLISADKSLAIPILSLSFAAREQTRKILATNDAFSVLSKVVQSVSTFYYTATISPYRYSAVDD